MAAHTAQSIAANASSLNTPKLGWTDSAVPTDTPSVVDRMVAAPTTQSQRPLPTSDRYVLAPIALATAIASSTLPFPGQLGFGTTFSSSPAPHQLSSTSPTGRAVPSQYKLGPTAFQGAPSSVRRVPLRLIKVEGVGREREEGEVMVKADEAGVARQLCG